MFTAVHFSFLAQFSIKRLFSTDLRGMVIRPHQQYTLPTISCNVHQESFMKAQLFPDLICATFHKTYIQKPCKHCITAIRIWAHFLLAADHNFDRNYQNYGLSLSIENIDCRNIEKFDWVMLRESVWEEKKQQFLTCKKKHHSRTLYLYLFALSLNIFMPIIQPYKN